MKYMLMMNVPGKAPYPISTWPKQGVEAHLAFLRQFNQRPAGLVNSWGLKA